MVKAAWPTGSCYVRVDSTCSLKQYSCRRGTLARKEKWSQMQYSVLRNYIYQVCMFSDSRDKKETHEASPPAYALLGSCHVTVRVL